MTRARSSTRWLAALLALGPWGCAAGVAPLVCTDEAPCPPPSSDVSWAAQLVPVGATHATVDTATVLTAQELPDVSFSAAGISRLRFAAPVLVRGVITDTDGARVRQARVTAQVPSGIPGQSGYSFDSLTDDLGAYTLRLPVPSRPQSQPYNFWIKFDDATLAAKYPPRSLTAVVSRSMEVSATLRGARDLFTVRGRVVDASGAGVGGMRMQVLDGRRAIVSTSTQTSDTAGAGGPVGSFQLLVDPALPSDGALHVVAWPGGEKSALPQLWQDLTQPLLPGGEQPLLLRVPAAARPVPFQLIVRGTGTSGATLPVAAARVQAQVYLSDEAMKLAGQKAIYIASGDSDHDGLVNLQLVPAPAGEMLSYTVTVTSPAQSSFASAPFVVAVGSQGGRLSPVTLPLRAQVSGRVVGADGQAMAGAQVVARSLQSDGLGVTLLGSVVVEKMMPETTTDGAGRFAMRLDQGDYALDLVPPSGTGARWSVDHQQVLNTDVDLGTLRLPRPGLGQLIVVGPDDYPVPGVNVRIFSMPTGSAPIGCTGLQPCGLIAPLRAEVYTDKQGRAQVLLPAQ